jgi:hypothetical protein
MYVLYRYTSSDLPGYGTVLLCISSASQHTLHYTSATYFQQTIDYAHYFFTKKSALAAFLCFSLNFSTLLLVWDGLTGEEDLPSFILPLPL